MTQQRVETTYADLRLTDLVIDKTGQSWRTADHQHSETSLSFWLLDSSGIRTHYLTKPNDDPVTVLRSPSAADKAAEQDRLFPDQTQQTTEDQGQAEVKRLLAAEPVTVVTHAEQDAADRGDEQTLPPFSDLTDLEMRSHLYVLHGVYGDDIRPRADLVAMHDRAHAEQESGKLTAKFRPHTHR